MKRSYKYRIYPNKEQVETLEQSLLSCRYLYNFFLGQKKDAYEKDKTKITCYDQIKEIAILKRENPELFHIYSQTLQDIPRRLNKSFQNFFRRVKQGEEPGYPRFKSHNRYNSLCYPQTGFKIKDGKLRLSKVGLIKIKLHREISGRIKTLSIKKTPTDKWYACFTTEASLFQPKSQKSSFRNNKMVGLDMGLTRFLTMSNGKKTDNPKYLKQSTIKLAKIQRRHSRKKLRSQNRKKSRIKVAIIHEKIANQRNDFLHKLSRQIVDKYNLIVVEKLIIKKMVRNRYLAKSISDTSWGYFLSMLSYKAAEAGKEVIKVNPKNTSQICCSCGRLVPKTLSTRTHKCPYCHLVMDRDHNAAKNILALAKTTITAGTAGINACGDCESMQSLKQEALLF